MNPSRYCVLYAIGAGSMVRITSPEHGGQPWTLRTARKARTCAATGQDIASGEPCYGPITNAANRMERIRADWVQGKLAKLKRCVCHDSPASPWECPVHGKNPADER